LDLNENILQNADIFTAKEIIKMQISYHSLNRDDSQNREIYEKKIEKMRNFGALATHSRVFLNFTWQVLRENFRENTPQNIKNKKHGMFWFLRSFKN
jgi:hypothetical protein